MAGVSVQQQLSCPGHHPALEVHLDPVDQMLEPLKDPSTYKPEIMLLPLSAHPYVTTGGVGYFSASSVSLSRS